MSVLGGSGKSMLAHRLCACAADEYTVGLEHHYNCNAGNQSTIREEVDANKEPQWGIAPEQVRAFIAANERSSEQACRQENVTGFKAMLSRHDHQVWALAKALWGTHESMTLPPIPSVCACVLARLHAISKSDPQSNLRPGAVSGEHR